MARTNRAPWRVADGTVVRLVRGTTAISATAALVGSGLMIANGYSGVWFDEFLAAQTVIAVCSGAFAWAVIAAQPRNAVVWTMAVASTTGLTVAGSAIATLIFDGDPSVVPPSELPPAAAWILLASYVGWGVGLNSMFTFGFLLFPDGRLPSNRWRVVAVLSAASIATVTIAVLVRLRPSNHGDPFSDGGSLEWALRLLLVCAAASLVALFGRMWRSSGVTRSQFKWVAWGAGVAVPMFVVAVAVGEGPYQQLTRVPFLLAVGVLLTCYGVAVGKYRLFDIDVVISRTLVYGALAACVSVVYVATVVGLGQLLGRGSEPAATHALVPTAIVAVMFEPLRVRLQQLVNRLVYGRTLTPHQVLSGFSRQVAATSDAVLTQVAQSLVDGTTATGASIGFSPRSPHATDTQWSAGTTSADHQTRSFPIKQQGTRFGHVVLFIPRGQQLSDEDTLLADRVASGLGLAVHNRVLTGALHGRIHALRTSRRRLAAAQDETRRRVARDLHDGAQQQLVSLKVKAGLAQTIAEREHAAHSAAQLALVANCVDAAIDAVRDFARGVYPPLLDTEGLATALAAHTRGIPIDTRVDADGLGRLNGNLEAAAYFCIVDLLDHFSNEGDATRATVFLSQADDALVDLDRGRVAASRSAIAQLTSSDSARVVDRVDATNGTLSLDASDDAVAFHASLPLAEPVHV